MERCAEICKNCLGSLARLAGQKRVPDPPAMIRAITLISLFID
jgi:hypothetical protein